MRLPTMARRPPVGNAHSAEHGVQVGSRSLSDTIWHAGIGEPMCKGTQSLVDRRGSSIEIALRLKLQPENAPLDRSEFALKSKQSGLIEVRCAKVEQLKATALSNSDAFPDKKVNRTQAAFQGGVELIIQRASAFDEYSGGDRRSVNLGKKNRQVIIFCKRSMQVLKKSKGLRKETIFGFSNMTMHLIEDMKIMELLARTDLDAAPLSLPDILTSCPPRSRPIFQAPAERGRRRAKPLR
jgi:hypothetical protein